MLSTALAQRLFSSVALVVSVSTALALLRAAPVSAEALEGWLVLMFAFLLGALHATSF